MALRAGHRVLNVDKLTYAGCLRSLADVSGHPEYSFAQVDIVDAADVNSLFRDFQPQAVMHLAAESHVDRSIVAPDAFVQTNIVGTFNLLQAALDHWRNLDSKSAEAFRLLHVSSDEVYGSLGATGKFNENSPYDPHSPYSASKAAADHLVRAWFQTYQLPVLVTHSSNNYGPFQFPEKLIPVVILNGLRGAAIPVYGSGEQVRDWLHVDDHCRALMKVLESGTPGETYSIGGHCELTNLDLVRQICALLDEQRPRPDGGSYADQITFVPDRPGHDLRYAMDTTKIEQELLWSPQQDHLSGLRSTVQWYLESEPWWQAIQIEEQCQHDQELPCR